MARDIQHEIQDMVTANKIVLFMKGTKLTPQCGFSARAVKVVGHYVDDFVTVNVLEDPEIRDGVKVFGDWPTIPQLYVDGKLVGGSDTIYEMHQRGELAAALSA